MLKNNWVYWKPWSTRWRNKHPYTFLVENSISYKRQFGNIHQNYTCSLDPGILLLDTYMCAHTGHLFCHLFHSWIDYIDNIMSLSSWGDLETCRHQNGHLSTTHVHTHTRKCICKVAHVSFFILVIVKSLEITQYLSVCLI